MKNTNIIIACIIIVILLIAGIYYYKNNTQSSGITFPSSGETLVAGETYTLKWNNIGHTGAPEGTTTHIFLVDVSLLSQGASVSIADRKYGVPDTGSYEYTIPTAVQEGTYFFVIGTTTSDNFEISVIPK